MSHDRPITGTRDFVVHGWWHGWRIDWVVILALLMATPSLAKKGNQPVYETAFDLAAGGASLTMAAQEGKILGNPALLPHGERFHQWAGVTTALLTTRDSVAVVRRLGQKGSAAEGSSGETSLAAAFDQATSAPLHLGVLNAVSWITNNFAWSLFDRVEPDLRIDRFGDSGLPEARFSVESYHGMALAAALRTGVRWLSFGVTGKYLLAAEPQYVVSTIDASTVSDLTDPNALRASMDHRPALGFDGGMLLFFQGRHVDFKVGGKIDDVGNTRFAGQGGPSPFRQVVSAGVGVTFHSTADALHLAVDYRDLEDSYAEPLYKKIHAGARLTVRNVIGVASGIYHGHPSLGMQIDALLLRISATYYTRELGLGPGIDARDMMLFALSVGF